MTDYVTPKGIAVWPKLNTPDTKFNVDGEYTVKLRLGAEESQDLIAKLEGIREKYKADQAKADPKVARYNSADVYEEEVDDQGNLTGSYLFKFKQKARITTKRGDTLEMKVALYDSNKQPTNANVTGGSTIRVAGTVFPYAMASSKTVGVSLRPSAVQVIQLAAMGGGADAVSMFDKEDGFVSDTFDSAAGAIADDADF